MRDLLEIRSTVLQQLLSSAIVLRIEHGAITREEYIRYMSDVYYYAQHSAQVIGMAAVRLVDKHPTMANYLFEHAREELGHDQWARSDLEDLGLSSKDIEQLIPSHACQNMVAIEYFYAYHDNPVGLFGWMYVLECLGGDAAGAIAKGLNSALDLNGKGLYFLTGHGEADEHHSEDLTEIISKEALSAEERECFHSVVSKSITAYLAILDHACGVK